MYRPPSNLLSNDLRLMADQKTYLLSHASETLELAQNTLCELVW